MRYSLLAFLLLMPAAAIGAPAPQSVLVRLPADDTAKAGWRQKENCTLAVAAEGAGTLDWNTRYGAFNFGWATWYPPKPLDMRDAYRIRFRVKGDGSGGILHLQLGVIDPGKPAVYYGNRADQVALTFTDWREAAFLLPRFGTGAARDREADLARINFVEFFVDRKGETQSCRILLQEMRVEAGTAAEQTAMAGYRQEAARASLPLRKDGSNLLPNAGFELDLSGAGAPDFWHGSDWSTGSRYSVERKSVHSGQTSIRLECANAGQRASYDMAIPLEPGPYVFEGWYHTRGVKAQKQHGVDARLIVQDAEDRQLFLTHAYGDPSKGGWRRLEARFTAPPGSARLSLCLFNYYAAGSVWWDDLSLRWDAEAAARMEAARVRDAAALKEAKAMVEEVSRSVEALAEGTTEEKVKKAALRWAVEDARLAMDAGQGVPSRALLEDVRAALARPIGRRVDPPAWLMPPVAKFTENPYVQGLLAQAKNLRASKEVFKKGEEGYKQLDNAWRSRGLGGEVCVLAWAFVHPESPYAGDPEVLLRALRRLQAVYQNHRAGDFNPGRQAIFGYDPNINRFTFVPTYEAHLLLRAAYPDLIPPSKEREWHESARVGAEFQVETYGNAVDPHAAGNYANMDAHYLLQMELAARLLEHPPYHAEAARFVGFMEKELFPDGAFSYLTRQNECYVYHDINVNHLARYWQLTGEKRAHDILVKSKPYYPYNVEPGGVPEYYTDPFWKHYWAGISPIGPEIIASLTDDPWNKRIANDALRHGKPGDYYSIYAATFWKDFPDKPLPDNYLMWDRNTEGPHGRYGRWSFGGTTRDYGPGAQGKDTFVGGMVVGEPTVPYPLDAALQVVTNQYRLRAGDPRYQTCRYLSQEEKNAVSLGAEFAGLTTRYRIQNVAWGGKSTLTDWAGQQEWLLMPGRLIGLLSIETLSDQEALSIHGRIRLGMHKVIEKKDDTFFKYGGLLVRLHEHNYADVVTEKSEKFFLDKPEQYVSTEIVLRDAAGIAGEEKKPARYPKGTRHFFVVEVLPYWSELAASVKRLETPDGLAGLVVEADGRRLILVHNPTDAQKTYRASAPAGTLVVHRSGSTQPAPLKAAGGEISVRIAPHAHVVIEAR